MTASNPSRTHRRTTIAAASCALLLAGVASASGATARTLSGDAPARTAAVKCVPTSPTPTVTVKPLKVKMGAILRVTGEGWCHPTNGGSLIAVKIDEGAYSRLDSSVHVNRTVWAIVQANNKTGKFSAKITLPNGTTSGANGSTPAFVTGPHTLRLLTGSLKAGDAIRTVQSGTFTVVKAAKGS